MEKDQIIVIGAGASGLMAAYQLSKAGEKVLVLEARGRTGGRINTIYNENGKIELGAEFVHGDLPVTLSLLNEAGIKYSPAGGDFWRYKNGKLNQEEEQIEGWDELISEMKKLEQDTTLNAFLEQTFPEDKHRELRSEVRRYVSGYDTADPDKVSVFALRNEWLNEDEDAQHRLNDGYCTMINCLVTQIKEQGGQVLLSQAVKAINWKENTVEVICSNGKLYKGSKAIVALPLGVLQSGELIFKPGIPAHTAALNHIGFGAIIKFLLRFKSPFWEDVEEDGFKAMGFVLSEEKVPTWWTQAPKHENLLTGWLGGNPARELAGLTDDELLDTALDSLAHIFGKSKDYLTNELAEWHIVNWTTDTFTRGSYAYDMVGSGDARNILSRSINNTLYFTGEYLYNGAAMGTVEAALTSGRDISATILSHTN